MGPIALCGYPQNLSSPFLAYMQESLPNFDPRLVLKPSNRVFPERLQSENAIRPQIDHLTLTDVVPEGADSPPVLNAVT